MRFIVSSRGSFLFEEPPARADKPDRVKYYALFLLGAALTFSGLAFADDGAKPSRDPFAEDLPTVEAAALHAQTLDEAPADVTIITREEIRTYGYRTLGEALESVRGFYTSNDHMYTYTGVRGFSLPGDYNTRFLVMINGHPMTDNILSSNGYFGQDLGLDIDLVERIEIVRGPSSALYGSNGIFATVNIVTISPVEFSKLYATTETGSFGEKKAMVAGSYYLGKGANLLLSASVVNNTGESFYFPEFDASAVGMDSERAYHTFANLVWHNWNITAFFNDRVKYVPLSLFYGANTFSTHANHVDSGRNYVNAVYTRKAGIGELRWEIAYDNLRFLARFNFQGDDGLEDKRGYAMGDWLDSRLSYRFGAGTFGSLTAGLEGTVDLRAEDYDREISPAPGQLSYFSRPDRNAALFLEDEKRLSSHWKLDGGVRLDENRYYGAFLSPRATLAFQPSPWTVYKFTYGRPFRNPSAFEQFYADGIGFLAAGALQSETANTFELTAQHHFRHGISGTASLYDYQLRNLIQAVYQANGAAQFQNVFGSKSRGVEFELGGKPRPWLELEGNFAAQKANPNDSGAGFANSPAYLAKFRWAIPGRRLTFSNSFDWMSSRLTYSGETLRPVLLASVTLTARLRGGLEMQAGVRNALNWAYMDPVGLSLDELEGEPRTAYLKLTWKTRP